MPNKEQSRYTEPDRIETDMEVYYRSNAVPFIVELNNNEMPPGRKTNSGGRRLNQMVSTNIHQKLYLYNHN